jgi:putative DNA primase/helicase
MAASNYGDVLDQLRAAGLLIGDGVEVGRMVRCHVNGEREKRGWYALHELQTTRGDLLIVGSYGIWRGNDNGAQKIELRKTELTAEQRSAIRQRLTEDRKRVNLVRQQEAERAARRASAAWAKCSPTGDAEYLAHKGVGAHGVRFSPSGAVVIPLLDTSGVIHGLQAIRTPAQAKRRPAKEFWPAGVVKKGHFHLIGIPTSIVLVAEGYATGASVHEATQLPTAIAFDAGNLQAVATALHQRYKTARILICADDDILAKCHARIHEGYAERTCNARFILTDNPEVCPSCGQPHHAQNTGVSAASAAALAVDGAWVAPVFADEAGRRARFLEHGTKDTDFNDLHLAEGLHVVRAQLEARITELGWRTVRAGAPTLSPPGSGDAALTPIGDFDELLNRYALVYGSETVFDRREHMLLSLKNLGHACVNGNIFKAWREHPDRTIVRLREVGFDPAGEDRQITCNLWAGWPTTPAAGSCERLLELLRFLCSDDRNPRELYDWVLRWLAYPIQHPGAKMKTALVMHGGSGAGKNLYFEAYMAIFGEYGRVIDQNAIDDKFNDWAERKLFLLADEVIARADLYQTKNKLKSLVTGDWIRINPKTIAAHDERNHVNIVFLSNEGQPVVLEEDDRRYTVIWTPVKRAALPSGGIADDAFYRAVREERDHGGIAALHDYLLTLDLGDFDAGALPPNTDARYELIKLSLDSPLRFYDAWGDGDAGVPWCPALTTDVYECYRVWCGRSGDRALTQARFVNYLARKRNVTVARKRYWHPDDPVTPRGPHGVLLPLGHECPPGAEEQRWLGQHIASFKAALKDLKGGLFRG